MKFGKLKTKILEKLVESFSTGNKSELKNVLSTIKENKNFREVYLFYEEIENKYFDDKEMASLYVEEVTRMLKNKVTNISDFCKLLDKKLGQIDIEENSVYSALDQLLVEDSLNNVDKKMMAKRRLVEHLMTKKEEKIEESTTFTLNENLLHAVLANNFNILYNKSLTENEKKELGSILSLSTDEVLVRINELKGDIEKNVENLLVESNDSVLIEKLNKVKNEISVMGPSKLNYYRLIKLKEGLR